MRIEGRKLKFTGELYDFVLIRLKDYALSFVTLGIYTFLGYPKAHVDAFVDEHLEWAPPRQEDTSDVEASDG